MNPIKSNASLKLTAKKVGTGTEEAVFFIQFFQVIGLQFEVSKIQFQWSESVERKAVQKISFSGMQSGEAATSSSSSDEDSDWETVPDLSIWRSCYFELFFRRGF